MPSLLRRFTSSAAAWVGLAFALSAPPADARCEQPALISTFESSTAYSYLYTPGIDPLPGGSSSMTADTIGYFWALGFGDPVDGAGIDNGGFTNDGWLALPGGYNASILTTWAVDNRIDGCIDSASSDPDCTAILLSDVAGDGTTWFTMMTAAETATRDYFFNLPGNAPIVLAAIPPPEVLSFDGFTATIAAPTIPPEGFQLDPACDSNDPANVLVGYRVYWYRQAPGGPRPPERVHTTDPTVVQGWWPAIGGTAADGTPLPPDTGAMIEIGCQPWDIYLALRLVFDSGFETGHVSTPTAAFAACSCDGPDADGDGYCAGTGATYEDCDDTRSSVFPGAPEPCDGLNNDCLAPGWPELPDAELDQDGDGFRACAECDDGEAAVFPGAPEVCDDLNNDCNHPNWPATAGQETVDDDGDGVSECDGDCWDFPTLAGVPGRTIYPGAPELCDGLSNDCLAPDWPAPPADELDGDQDGSLTCADCDDADPTVFPGAPQLCDELNNDCDNPNWPATAGEETVDDDGDGISECDGDCWDFPTLDGVPGDLIYPGAPELCDGLANDCLDPDWPAPPAIELDLDQDGSLTCADCNDANPDMFPGAPQICDELNNDCDDPSWPEVDALEMDGDDDGFIACAECDDSSAAVFPGATQVCDGVNNDCDDPTWPTPPADELDNDGDGSLSCADCDDSDSRTYPGAPQFCDGINNDCLDPNWPEVARRELDLDGDGFFQCRDCDDDDATAYPEAPQLCGDLRNNDCRDPNWPLLDGTNEDDVDDDGITECEGDCGPLDSSVYPGAPEICDGLNNDCDDPSWPTPPAEEADADGDDSPACADCDDADASVFPGAPQFCDGINNDCDNPTWPEVPTTERDDDADGFLGCDECDDSEPAVYPGAPEICDGLNNDCLDPFWPAPPDEDADNDGDGLSACDGDCDDTDLGTFPGAPQVCDGVNNDCSDPNWPALPEDEVDGDGDGSPVCADCDDADSRVYPLAPQACDGINNDCLDLSFPNLEGTNEFDDDGDGFTECAGDCADDDPLRNPGAEEDCRNGIDDDCDGLVDYFDMADCVDLFVVLDAFTATAEPNGVRLGWTTSQEIDSVGFHVLRSSGGRRTERLTLQPILSRGDAVNGADYEYLDTDRLSLDNVRYWLEEIDIRGEITRFGPITVSQPAAAGGRR